MKSISTIICALLFSLSTYAAQDGRYTCGTQADKMQYVYEIKNVDMNGTQLPLLTVTKTTFGNPEQGTEDKTYTIKGLATHFSSDKGDEIIILGNTTLELTNGRPGCAQ